MLEQIMILHFCYHIAFSMLLIAQPVHAVDTYPEIKATNYNLLVHLDTKKINCKSQQ